MHSEKLAAEDPTNEMPDELLQPVTTMTVPIGEKLEGLFEEVVKRNPGEVEFHQAVREVLESLGPVLGKHPEFGEHKIIERICEPERQIIFRAVAGRPGPGADQPGFPGRG